MVGTIKTRAREVPVKGEQTVLLPGPTAAEPWEMWSFSGAQAELVRAFSRPADNRLSLTTTFALPVAQVYCLPLWLNESGDQQMKELIPLQLELRGLQARGQEPVIFDSTVAAQEASRTLLTVGVLPSSFSQPIQADNYRSFDISARYLPLPQDALILWREQDALICAITRGASLVYFQSLGQGPLGMHVLQDLACILASLSLQGVMTPLRQITLWTDATPSEQAALQQKFGVPVHQGERPRPRMPAASWNLVPPTVVQARQAHATRRWWRRGILVVLALYFLLVVTFLAQLLLTSAQVKGLEAWQAAHAVALAQVRDTRAAWENLQPVVDEPEYPLELLLHVAESIPGEQLHLTLFEAGGGHLLIKGEAKNVSGAFEFLDKLKRDPALNRYTWDMGQPNLLPNDLAQFQIEGSQAGGATE